MMLPSISKSTKIIVLVSLLVLGSTGSLCYCEDWPQFRGPTRNGICREAGLLKKWPPEGPELLWSAEQDLGQGYSSASISNGTVFITGMKDKQGVLFAFDIEGRLKWKKAYGPEWSGSWPGSRSTPTVDGEKIYVHSGKGTVYCFKTGNGDMIWSKDLAEDYEGISTRWGWAESLLIVEDKLICTPCGKKATMVAIDKTSGKVVWDEPDIGEISAYCSPTFFDHKGRKIIAYRTDLTFFGADAESGRILWKYDCEEFMKPAKPPHVHVNAPLYLDGCIYITSGYDAGGAMFELSEKGDDIALKWLDKTLDVHLGGVVLLDGCLYGSNYVKKGKSDWIALDWNTGKPRYRNRWNGDRGAVIYGDGMLYCYSETTGELALVHAGHELKVVSVFNVPKGRSQYWWAHPSISNGRLYLRQDSYLWCYDIKARKKSGT